MERHSFHTCCMLDLYLFQIAVILRAEEKIVKLGETIVLGCTTDTNGVIWSYLNNTILESVTLMEDSAVNPGYTNKVELTFVDTYCLQIINVSSQDEGIYICYKQRQKSSIKLKIAGNFHFVFEYDIQQDYKFEILLCFIKNCVYG